MNHFGTLSALQPVLISAGIIMHRCRRRFNSDEQRYYLEDAHTGNISPDLTSRTSRRGYTLSEILSWLYQTGQQPVSQNAHLLLKQLDYTGKAVA